MQLDPSATAVIPLYQVVGGAIAVTISVLGSVYGMVGRRLDGISGDVKSIHESLQKQDKAHALLVKDVANLERRVGELEREDRHARRNDESMVALREAVEALRDATTRGRP